MSEHGSKGNPQTDHPSSAFASCGPLRLPSACSLSLFALVAVRLRQLPRP